MATILELEDPSTKLVAPESEEEEAEDVEVEEEAEVSLESDSVDVAEDFLRILSSSFLETMSVVLMVPFFNKEDKSFSKAVFKLLSFKRCSKVLFNKPEDFKDLRIGSKLEKLKFLASPTNDPMFSNAPCNNTTAAS